MTPTSDPTTVNAIAAIATGSRAFSLHLDEVTASLAAAMRREGAKASIAMGGVEWFGSTVVALKGGTGTGGTASRAITDAMSVAVRPAGVPGQILDGAVAYAVWVVSQRRPSRVNGWFVRYDEIIEAGLVASAAIASGADAHQHVLSVTRTAEGFTEAGRDRDAGILRAFGSMLDALTQQVADVARLTGTTPARLAHLRVVEALGMGARERRWHAVTAWVAAVVAAAHGPCAWD